MRILAMVHYAPPRHCAGAEMMTFAMLRALVERGHQVDVQLSRVTPDPAPFEYDGMTVHPRHDVHSDPFRFLPAADLVVTHLENTARAVILARGAHIPFAIVCHNDHQATAQWLVDDAAALVYNSEWMRASLGPRPNDLLVYPPVVAEDYRTDRQGNGSVTLINLNRNKGAETFYALAERMPDVPFLGAIGAHGDQVRRELPNVTILEHRDGRTMREVYARTKILLAPSVYESWGRVGVEAMASGIPVIAHPTPGLRESLGDAGMFVDRDDVDGYEAAVRRLLTPRGYGAASKRARDRSAQLDPTNQLAAWCDRVEAAAQRGRRIRHAHRHTAAA